MADVPAQPSSPSAERPGGRSFELHECLGRGGFGEVYRASMVMPSGVRTVVAVKVLRHGLDPFGQSVQRLRDEAHLLSALDHPAILKVHDLVLLDDRVALVTEYVEGEDLSKIFQHPEDGFGPRALAETIAQVADALEAAWSRPIDGRPMQLVHRDIKPANVRLGRHGQVKLLDFGIARANIEREASTTTDTLLGTYQYMAPERFGGAAGPHADIFALGCLFFEGIAGRRFLNGLALQQHYTVLADRSNYDPALAEQLAQLGDLPGSTKELLARALAFDPAERPSAGDLAAMCEAEAPFLRGTNLRTWARERAWAGGGRAGELSGRVIPEGRVDAPPSSAREPSVPQPAPVYERRTDARAVRRGGELPPSVETVELSGELTTRRRTRGTPLWVWGTLLVALAVTGAGVFALATGVVVGQLWPIPDAPDPAPAPVPVPVPAPAVAPAPAQPAPGATPGRFRASGDASVALVAGDGTPFRADQPVPPGTYGVSAHFHGDPGPTVLRDTSVEVTPGSEIAVVCEATTRRCGIGGPPPPLPAPVAPTAGIDAEVRANSPVPVRLEDARGVRHEASGRLPVGSYVLRADFGQGYERAGSGSVQAGRVNLVRCKKLMRTCAIEGG